MLLIYIVALFIVIIYYIYLILTKNHDYWKKRNVPYLAPTVLFGNYREYILMKTYMPHITKEICEQFPNEPYIGIFYGTEPALVLQDPSIIKLVLQNNFNHFTGREITEYSHKETFTNLIFFQGSPPCQWKVLRQNLTPLYTSAKIKNMFPLIKTCAKEFEILLEEETKGAQKVNIRPLLARYTMDNIISCVFGFNANCMKIGETENPFVAVGLKIFDTSLIRGFKMACRSIWPWLFYGLRFQMFDETIRTFFLKLFTEMSNNQRNDGTSKTDFLNLILDWKKNSHLTGSFYSPEGEKKTVSIEVNDELLTAQCAGFFGGGYETTASTLCFLLFELAKNERVQQKVIEEVDAYLKRNKDAIEYNCVTELPYIEACIEETLRLYPAFATLTREVSHRYTLPTGLQLQKGDRVHIPVYHIHRNPNHFPEPEIYRPERFLREERHKIEQFAYLAFGEGPRVCMGARFVKMPLHAGVITIFKKYRLELSEGMSHNLDFQPTGIVTQSATDIYLKFIRRHE